MLHISKIFFRFSRESGFPDTRNAVKLHALVFSLPRAYIRVFDVILKYNK